MKIYTKTGDLGETGLLGGVRVQKNNPVIEVTGNLDETNCCIGHSISLLQASATALPELENQLTAIQQDLFEIGSRVANCLKTVQGKSNRIGKFDSRRTTCLENWIDHYDEKLPPMQAFILPGGSQSGSSLHLARSVCRRTERSLVDLIQSNLSNGASDEFLCDELIFLNRLSDLLFVMARYTNQINQVPETQWLPSQTNDPV